MCGAQVVEVLWVCCKHVVAVEAMVELCLVWYGGRYLVHSRRCHEVPVAEVIAGELGVRCRAERLRVGEVEGVGVGEEVGEGLALHVTEQRLPGVVQRRGRAMEEVAVEGV